MRLKLLAPPAADPVTIGEAKKHARIYNDVEDDLIKGWITAATTFCEREVSGHRAFVEQQWSLLLECFPMRSSSYGGSLAIELPIPPLISIEQVKYYDADDAEQTLDPADYRSIASYDLPGILEPTGTAWPATRRDRTDAVEIDFKAGYGEPKDVPPLIKAAIYKVVAELYEQREETLVGAVSAKTEIGVRRMLRKFDYGFYP